MLCSCLEVYGEDPSCALHGIGTDWWAEEIAHNPLARAGIVETLRQHGRRVSELLAANNREVERRREAEVALERLVAMMPAQQHGSLGYYAMENARSVISRAACPESAVSLCPDAIDKLSDVELADAIHTLSDEFELRLRAKPNSLKQQIENAETTVRSWSTNRQNVSKGWL